MNDMVGCCIIMHKFQCVLIQALGLVWNAKVIALLLKNIAFWLLPTGVIDYPRHGNRLPLKNGFVMLLEVMYSITQSW